MVLKLVLHCLFSTRKDCYIKFLLTAYMYLLSGIHCAGKYLYIVVYNCTYIYTVVSYCTVLPFKTAACSHCMHLVPRKFHRKLPNVASKRRAYIAWLYHSKGAASSRTIWVISHHILDWVRCNTMVLCKMYVDELCTLIKLLRKQFRPSPSK